MKKTKIIIPAIGMLLLSTAASITGTVAWFSMNTTVTATGMQVKAKADQVYLQIINLGGTFSNTDPQNTVVASNASKEISVSNVVKANGGATTTLFDGTAAVWVTNVSLTPGSAAPAGAYVTIDQGVADAGLANYALINDFQVRLNPTAGVDTAADPLKVTGVTFDSTTLALTDPMRNAVSVLIKAGTRYQLFKQANPTLPNAGTVGAGTFTEVGNYTLTSGVFTSVAGVATDVRVYVFIDGDNNSAYTNNVTVNGYTVNLAFSVDY